MLKFAKVIQRKLVGNNGVMIENKVYTHLADCNVIRSNLWNIKGSKVSIEDVI